MAAREIGSLSLLPLHDFPPFKFSPSAVLLTSPLISSLLTSPLPSLPWSPPLLGSFGLPLFLSVSIPCIHTPATPPALPLASLAMANGQGLQHSPPQVACRQRAPASQPLRHACSKGGRGQCHALQALSLSQLTRCTSCIQVITQALEGGAGKEGGQGGGKINGGVIPTPPGGNRPVKHPCVSNWRMKHFLVLAAWGLGEKMQQTGLPWSKELSLYHPSTRGSSPAPPHTFLLLPSPNSPADKEGSLTAENKKNPAQVRSLQPQLEERKGQLKGCLKKTPNGNCRIKCREKLGWVRESCAGKGICNEGGKGQGSPEEWRDTVVLATVTRFNWWGGKEVCWKTACKYNSFNILQIAKWALKYSY